MRKAFNLILLFIFIGLFDEIIASQNIIAFKECNAQINRIREVANPPLPQKLEADGRKIKWVIQEEYAYTSAQDKAPLLATFNIKTCIGIVIYNKEEKKGALGHISSGIDISNSLNLLIEAVTTPHVTSSLYVHLRGGWIDFDPDEREFILKILNNIKEQNIEIRSAEFFTTYQDATLKFEDRSFNVNKLAFDTSTGQVFTDFYINIKSPIYSILNKDCEALLNSLLQKLSYQKCLKPSNRIGSL